MEYFVCYINCSKPGVELDAFGYTQQIEASVWTFWILINSHFTRKISINHIFHHMLLTLFNTNNISTIINIINHNADHNDHNHVHWLKYMGAYIVKTACPIRGEHKLRHWVKLISSKKKKPNYRIKLVLLCLFSFHSCSITWSFVQWMELLSTIR